MKEPYVKMKVTPHRISCESSLLQGSIITDQSVILSTGHEIGETYGGTETTGGAFSFDWE